MVTVTITVDDGTNPVEGALVRLSKPGDTGILMADANGEVEFSADDATWTVTITANGFELFSTADLVVNGDETVTYSLSALAITPGTGDETTGYLTVLDASHNPVGGVTVDFVMTEQPKKAGRLFQSEKQSAVSAAGTGLVQVPLAKGGRYEASIGSQSQEFEVPESAGTTLKIEDLLI